MPENLRNNQAGNHLDALKSKYLKSRIEDLAIIFRRDRSNFSTLGLYISLLNELQNSGLFKDRFNASIDGYVGHYETLDVIAASILTYEGQKILNTQKDLIELLGEDKKKPLVKLHRVYKKEEGDLDLEDSFDIASGGQGKVGYALIRGSQDSTGIRGGGVVAIKTMHPLDIDKQGLGDIDRKRLKKLEEKRKEGFLREAGIQKNYFWKPGMVPAFGVYKDPDKQGEMSLVQPYVPGNDVNYVIHKLQDILALSMISKNKIDGDELNKLGIRLQEVFDLFFQGFESIHYLNKSGILFRDINPRNFLCIRGGDKSYYFLTDPGAAVYANKMHEGPKVWTYAFSPLESQFEYENGVQKFLKYKSDIASLGYVLHYMMTGYRLFSRSDGVHALSMDQRNEELRRLVYKDHIKFMKNDGVDLREDCEPAASLFGYDLFGLMSEGINLMIKPNPKKRGSNKEIYTTMRKAYELYKKGKSPDISQEPPLLYNLDHISEVAPFDFFEIENRQKEARKKAIALAAQKKVEKRYSMKGNERESISMTQTSVI